MTKADQELSRLRINLDDWYINFAGELFGDSPEKLKREAEELEQHPVKPPKLPPWQIADCKTEIANCRSEIERLQAEIKENEKKIKQQQRRITLRDVAEWKHVRSSPTALRYYAELVEEAIEERRRNQAELEREYRRKREEQLRQQAESLGVDIGGGNPLDVLDLPGTATPDEIKTRFRELTKRLHPDANGGNPAANGLLRKVTAAMGQLRLQGRVR